jgi:hypothetical protein
MARRHPSGPAEPVQHARDDASSGATSASSAASGKASAAASSNSGTSLGGLAAGSTLFPAAVGNTWVYVESLSADKGTSANRILSVAPTAGGQKVIMGSSTDIPGITTDSKPITETLIFHSDGSISLPLTQLGSSAITIKSGGVVWPSAADVSSGQPKTSTIVMSLKEAGQTTTVTAHVVVQGGGSATVTVPAGTYQTTLINETISEKFGGIAVKMEIQNWDASGVGPVKSDVISTAGGHTTTISKQELKSFTKG